MFYKYKVTYYNEHTGEEVPGEGLVFAKDYGKAANKVVDDYGKDNIIDLYLYEIMIDGIHCIDKEELDYAFKVH